MGRASPNAVSDGGGGGGGDGVPPPPPVMCNSCAAGAMGSSSSLPRLVCVLVRSFAGLDWTQRQSLCCCKQRAHPQLLRVQQRAQAVSSLSRSLLAHSRRRPFGRHSNRLFRRQLQCVRNTMHTHTQREISSIRKRPQLCSGETHHWHAR